MRSSGRSPIACCPETAARGLSSFVDQPLSKTAVRGSLRDAPASPEPDARGTARANALVGHCGIDERVRHEIEAVESDHRDVSNGVLAIVLDSGLCLDLHCDALAGHGGFQCQVDVGFRFREHSDALPACIPEYQVDEHLEIPWRSEERRGGKQS